MVSILPSERTPWDVIGGKAGQALQQVLPGAIEQRQNRERSMNALNQAQSEIAQANGDPMKIALAFSKVAVTSPEAAKALGPIAQTAMTLGQRTKGAADFPVGQGQPRGPTKQGEQPGEQVPVSVSDLVPSRPSSIKNPQGIPEFQLPYGPEEIAGIRQKSRQLGYLPDMEERFVKDAMEFNQVAEQRRTAEQNNYNQQQQQFLDTVKNQELFSNYMENNAKELWQNPDDRELSLKAAEKVMADPKNRNTSFADILGKVKQEVRPYQAAKEALKKTLNRPLFGQTKEQRDLARPRAQMMVKMGQKPQLQLMIAQGGNGEVEEADLLNPLPEKFEGDLNKFNKFVRPLDFVTNIDPESKEYQEQINRGQERLSNQKKYMTNFLSDNMTSGTYDKPGTNVLLVRAHLMKNGLGWEDSAKVIDDSIEQGKLKLDPQQQIDYQKLAYPPLTGDTYLDTVLNNVLFPITGRQ